MGNVTGRAAGRKHVQEEPCTQIKRVMYIKGGIFLPDALLYNISWIANFILSVNAE